MTRLFNRLDAAVTHHETGNGFPVERDAALYHARDRIIKDFAKGEG